MVLYQILRYVRLLQYDIAAVVAMLMLLSIVGRVFSKQLQMIPFRLLATFLVLILFAVPVTAVFPEPLHFYPVIRRLTPKDDDDEDEFPDNDQPEN